VHACIRTSNEITRKLKSKHTHELKIKLKLHAPSGGAGWKSCGHKNKMMMMMIIYNQVEELDMEKLRTQNKIEMRDMASADTAGRSRPISGYDYFDSFEEQAPMPGAEQQNVFFSYIE
jgi:hypothetical protein